MKVTSPLNLLPSNKRHLNGCLVLTIYILVIPVSDGRGFYRLAHERCTITGGVIKFKCNLQISTVAFLGFVTCNAFELEKKVLSIAMKMYQIE